MRSAIPKSLVSVDVDRLKRHFLAWWEGEDVINDDPQPELPSPAPTGAGDAESLPSSVQYNPRVPQLAAHMMIAQMLWGEGFVGPGGAEYILDLVSQLGISRDKSIAYLGLGLGGPAREICRDTGVWVSGYETRADLIEPASEQSLMAGLARKVSVQHFDPATTELPERKFHFVLSREELHGMTDRERVMAACFDALRPGGGILFTDYVLTEAGDRAALESSAFSAFWGAASLSTAQDYASLLRGAGFDLRVKKDITPAYVDLIGGSTGGWGRIMALVESGDERIGEKRDFVMVMAREAALWAERLEALKQGHLAVYRFFALKPDNEIS